MGARAPDTEIGVRLRGHAGRAAHAPGGAVTKWLGVSLDLQIINPALKKVEGSSGDVGNLSTSVVGGLRAYARF